jgi:hypothetical protein
LKVKIGKNIFRKNIFTLKKKDLRPIFFLGADFLTVFFALVGSFTRIIWLLGAKLSEGPPPNQLRKNS